MLLYILLYNCVACCIGVLFVLRACRVSFRRFQKRASNGGAYGLRLRNEEPQVRLVE